MSATESPRHPGPVRVVVVDDTDDVRLLLRLQFRDDPRFEVVAEGTDGEQAIALAEAEHPDLIVLDRQMPKLSGVEAIPEIRRRSPETAIVLYTAGADAGAYQAALAAGAVEVLEKSGSDLGFVDRLVGVLLERGSEADATVEIHVGPVSGEAARVWVTNTRTIIDAVAAYPDVVGTALPDDVVELFRSFLTQWGEVAADAEEFRWAARARPADVSRIVEHWATIDRMTDEQLERLGIHWSPAAGEPFFHALTAGVLEALGRHEETRRLAALLGDQWAYLQRDR